MLLRTVILENYGLYKGKNTFDLTPKKKRGIDEVKPIILFGGKNGAGKTTLLDAVRLTLYGKQSLGSGITSKKYLEHLSSKIHRSKDPKQQQPWARIAVEFDYVTQGKQDCYYVERRWRRSEDGDILEKLDIRRNDIVIDDIEAKHWDAFAASIVPERLSQLFFFDGEKIKAMAEDITGSATVKESINSLLGLDLVHRLKTDLDLYQSKEAKKHSSAEDQKQIRLLSKECEKIENVIADLRNQFIDKQEDLEGLTETVQGIENELHAAGSAYADQRVAEQQTQLDSEAEIEIVAKQLRLACESPFALTLCPTIARQLTTQLKAETVIKEHDIVASTAEKIKTDLEKGLKKTKAATQEQSDELRILIETVIEKHTTLPKKYGDISIIHDLSPQSSFRIQEWLQSAKKSASSIRKLSTQLERLHHRQQNASEMISRAPDEEALQPIVERLNEVTGLAGKTRAEQDAINEEIHKHQFRLDELKREQKKVETTVLAQKKFIAQTQLIKQTQQALTVYQTRLTKMKIETLQQTVTECFNHLVRKGDLLHKIRIDSKSFAVTLHDRNGNSIPKEDLSSGEKQIYAISVLWGLAKTSGRPLPVIIDTPLGRLDSDHRLNLIQNYFPQAGHQVILLSTDTEVDEGLYSKLQPHISRCYHLKYDDKNRLTTSEEEYFWKEIKNG